MANKIRVEIKSHAEPAPSERIPTAAIYRDGEYVGNHSILFKPGMIIERGDRKYEVDAKGTQRRIK